MLYARAAPASEGYPATRVPRPTGLFNTAYWLKRYTAYRGPQQARVGVHNQDIKETTTVHSLDMHDGPPGKRQEGGIEPLHVSMPRELKSRPSTSPTHPGRMLAASILVSSISVHVGTQMDGLRRIANE